MEEARFLLEALTRSNYICCFWEVKQSVIEMYKRLHSVQ